MPPQLLHQTDLFRPAIDPDDHWDLACVYSLVAQQKLHLTGVLLDFPPSRFPGRSPDVVGIAQLNYLTGQAVPVSVGSAAPYKQELDQLGQRDQAGAQFVLRTLESRSEPTAISIVGSCRDVARALIEAPEVFAERCAGIYLNAGTGSPDPTLAANLEYNVRLNPEAYAAIFNAPCPIYWMPCFEEIDSKIGSLSVRQYGTWYTFPQEEILPHLSAELGAYFTYSLEGRTDSRYLQPVVDPASDVLSPYTLGSERSMWCTYGFFHAAGLDVGRDGSVALSGELQAEPVCDFLPISVTCDEHGVTRWTPDAAAQDRFIFRIRHVDDYPNAMLTAMRGLLSAI